MSLPLFRIASLPQKGIGMIACEDISRGTLLLSEKPLFKIPRHAQDPKSIQSMVVERLHGLNKDEQREFFGLCNSFDTATPFVGIVKTNAIPLGVDAGEGGILPLCSRFNHSCVCNALFSWNGVLGMERVYAVKDIPKGEEITVNYLPEVVWTKARGHRQNHMMQSFGFECRCKLCTTNPEGLARSDARRKRISELRAAVGDGMLIMMNPNSALRHCQDTLRLIREEGGDGMLLYGVYYDAFQICVAHSDFARASTFAALATGVKVQCEGKDAEGLEEIRSLRTTPEKHRLAGQSNKWRSKAKFARAPNTAGLDDWLWQRAG